MTFSDFVESVVETPICCELKQHLDTLHEVYTKDPEKCVLSLNKSQQRGSAKSHSLMILLPLLLKLYEEAVSE